MLPEIMKALEHPLTPVVVVSIATAAALCGIAGAGVAFTAAELAQGYAWSFALVLWMDTDARRSGRFPCYDFAFFLWILMPLSLIWYCFWSRGWRGVLMLLFLLALWFVPYLLAASLWVVLRV